MIVGGVSICGDELDIVVNIENSDQMDFVGNFEP